MSEDLIFKLIANVGIPAGIAVYILVEMNKTIKGVQNAIQAQTRATFCLREAIVMLLDKLDFQEESRQLREDERLTVIK